MIWDNIGLKQEDKNLAAYQIMADVFQRLDIHSGTVFNYHQNRRKTKNYLADLELLQYDILYGEQYVYGGKEHNPVHTGYMQMGVLDTLVTGIVPGLQGGYTIYGENFTQNSKVYVNEEKQSATFLNNTRLDLQETELKNGDRIKVCQVGSSSRIFRESAEWIFYDEKLLTEEQYLAAEEAKKAAEEAEKAAAEAGETAEEAIGETNE